METRLLKGEYCHTMEAPAVTTVALNIEEAKRLHDTLLAQVHVLREKLGYERIITRSMLKRIDRDG